MHVEFAMYERGVQGSLKQMQWYLTDSSELFHAPRLAMTLPHTEPSPHLFVIRTLLGLFACLNSGGMLEDFVREKHCSG